MEKGELLWLLLSWERRVTEKVLRGKGMQPVPGCSKGQNKKLLVKVPSRPILKIVPMV